MAKRPRPDDANVPAHAFAGRRYGPVLRCFGTICRPPVATTAEVISLEIDVTQDRGARSYRQEGVTRRLHRLRTAHPVRPRASATPRSRGGRPPTLHPRARPRGIVPRRDVPAELLWIHAAWIAPDRRSRPARTPVPSGPPLLAIPRVPGTPPTVDFPAPPKPGIPPRRWRSPGTAFQRLPLPGPFRCPTLALAPAFAPPPLTLKLALALNSGAGGFTRTEAFPNEACPRPPTLALPWMCPPGWPPHVTAGTSAWKPWPGPCTCP